MSSEQGMKRFWNEIVVYHKKAILDVLCYSRCHCNPSVTRSENSSPTHTALSGFAVSDSKSHPRLKHERHERRHIHQKLIKSNEITHYDSTTKR